MVEPFSPAGAPRAASGSASESVATGSHPLPPGERWSRAEKLRRSADYARCYRTGRRRAGPLLYIVFLPNALPHPRLGITASRKVGGAVVRNRLKRRIREVVRRWPERSNLRGLDVVVHLQPAAARADFPELQKELVRLLRTLPLLPAPVAPPAS